MNKCTFEQFTEDKVNQIIIYLIKTLLENEGFDINNIQSEDEIRIEMMNSSEYSRITETVDDVIAVAENTKDNILRNEILKHKKGAK